MNESGLLNLIATVSTLSEEDKERLIIYLHSLKDNECSLGPHPACSPASQESI